MISPIQDSPLPLLSSLETSGTTSASANAVLEEALRCVALLTRCASAAVLELGPAQRVVGAVGPTPAELGLRFLSSALRRREPLWIADASAPNPHARGKARMAVASLPLRAGDDGSPRVLVLVREGTGAWSPELRQTAESFVRLIETASQGVTEAGEEAPPPLLPRDAAQALVDSISDLAWMKDAQSRFMAVNQALASLVGRTPQEMLGKTDSDFFPAEISDTYVRGDAVVLQNGQPFHTVEPIVDGSGTPHWIETVKNPVRDERGNVIAITGVARDVTARHELEIERNRLIEQLAHERNRLQDMIANVPGVVWEQMFDGSYSFVSDQVEAILGYTVDEYPSNLPAYLALAHDDDRASLEKWTHTIIASGKCGSHTHTYRVRRRDGTYVWLESHWRIIFDASGTAVGARGVSLDVGFRKEAEEQLRASEQHFRDLADVTPVMIFTTNADGGCEFQNRRVLEFTGLSPEELKGQRWHARIHPDHRARIVKAWREAHERQVWPSVETCCARHDGEYRDLLIEATPRYASDGAFTGFAGTCIDLTDRRRLEHRLEQERQLTSLGRLAATIAHEINNVLMGIQPFADVIRRSPAGGVDLERAANHISNSVQRGRRITHEILRFANTSDPVLQPLQVGPWLEQISQELTSVLGAGVVLELDVSDSARMLADRHQMTQVLTNLAANARDAMSGTGTFRVASRLERSWSGLPAESGPFVHLIVSNDGPGIPEELLDQIFEPLFTTKTTGTGLGLAIVRDVIRRHGGDVLVENAPGSGAIFHLIVKGTAEEPLHVVRRCDSLPDSVRRILLVEDDETVALGLTALLELEGIEVAVVSRGGEAVEAITSFQPDVVTLDIGLPDMPGTVVFEQIRRRWQDLPVLFSTGHAGTLATEIDALGGPTAHLLKPYDLNTFVAAVRRLVGEPK